MCFYRQLSSAGGRGQRQCHKPRPGSTAHAPTPAPHSFGPSLEPNAALGGSHGPPPGGQPGHPEAEHAESYRAALFCPAVRSRRVALSLTPRSLGQARWPCGGGRAGEWRPHGEESPHTGAISRRQSVHDDSHGEGAAARPDQTHRQAQDDCRRPASPAHRLPPPPHLALCPLPNDGQTLPCLPVSVPALNQRLPDGLLNLQGHNEPSLSSVCPLTALLWPRRFVH